VIPVLLCVLADWSWDKYSKAQREPGYLLARGPTSVMEELFWREHVLFLFRKLSKLLRRNDIFVFLFLRYRWLATSSWYMKIMVLYMFIYPQICRRTMCRCINEGWKTVWLQIQGSESCSSLYHVGIYYIFKSHFKQQFWKLWTVSQLSFARPFLWTS